MTLKLEEDKNFEIYKQEYAEKDYNIVIEKLNAGTFKLNETHKKDLHNAYFFLRFLRENENTKVYYGSFNTTMSDDDESKQRYAFKDLLFGFQDGEIRFKKVSEKTLNITKAKGDFNFGHFYQIEQILKDRFVGEVLLKIKEKFIDQRIINVFFRITSNDTCSVLFETKESTFEIDFGREETHFTVVPYYNFSRYNKVELEKDYIGDLMSIEDFKKGVVSGLFISSDGIGQLVMNGKIYEHLYHSPKVLVKLSEYPDVTHILWLNN